MVHPIAIFHEPFNMNIFHGQSNFPVYRSLDIQYSDCWPSRPLPRKRVCFNNKIRIVENPGFLAANEIERVWWSGEELQSIKKNAKQMCVRLRKQREAVDESCPISDAYQKTQMVLESNAAKHPALCLAKNLGGELQQWCATVDGRRGLERFASRDFAIMRRKDVIDTRSAVIVEQARQLQTGVKDDEAIARVAKLSSKTARVFAAFMGDADVHASHSDDDDNEEEAMECDWSSDCSNSSSESNRPFKRNKLNHAGNSPAA